MIGQKQLRLRSIVPIFTAGIFVFLLYIYFLVPFNDLVQTFQQVNPFYIFLALAVLFIAHGFYAFTWQKLLEMLSVKASFTKAFQYTWVANFVDILVPAESVSGDFLRIYLLSKEKSGDAGKIAASVLCHRILVTIISVLGLLISTMYFMIYNNPPTLVLQIIVAIAVLNAVVLGLVIYVSIKKEAAEKIVNWTIKALVHITRGRWKFEHLKESATKTMNKFYEGITVFRQNPKGFIVPVFSSIIAVILDILIMALVFLSIGPIEAMISLSALIIVYSSSAIVHYIPIVSGELGTMEIFLTTMFTLLGNQQAIAIYTAATVLIRILTLWVRLFVGGIIVQIMGIKSLTTKNIT
ncbi:MAG: lysylphosphatidylglycerol synthase transmembrane domain-containing protein [Candidatus Bathyarchaeia archaeon]